MTRHHFDDRSGTSHPRPQRRTPGEEHHRRQPSDPTVCPTCGALFSTGRWVWASSPPLDAARAACPACRAIENDDPAGIVLLEGELHGELRDEIENLIHNVEQRESAEHPLKRIFGVEESDGGLRVRTTDARLAHAIGRAVHHAYHGQLEEPQSNEEPVRIRWLHE